MTHVAIMGQLFDDNALSKNDKALTSTGFLLNYAVGIRGQNENTEFEKFVLNNKDVDNSVASHPLAIFRLSGRLFHNGREQLFYYLEIITI